MLQRPVETRQYRAIRYTERLAEAGAVASVGSRGDSYDNAAAEALNSLFKAELIRNKGPWAGISDVEIAVAEWVEWYNHRRLHGELGYLPPAEYETNHYANHHQASSPELATHGSLHETRGDTLAGNHVLIESDGVVVALCHLQQGSLKVRTGQRVQIGTGLARCGNSGNSTEPHVHIQAITTPDIERAAAVPLTFRGTLPRNGAVIDISD